MTSTEVTSPLEQQQRMRKITKAVNVFQSIEELLTERTPQTNNHPLTGRGIIEGGTSTISLQFKEIQTPLNEILRQHDIPEFNPTPNTQSKTPQRQHELPETQQVLQLQELPDFQRFIAHVLENIFPELNGSLSGFVNNLLSSTNNQVGSEQIDFDFLKKNISLLCDITEALNDSLTKGNTASGPTCDCILNILRMWILRIRILFETKYNT